VLVSTDRPPLNPYIEDLRLRLRNSVDYINGALLLAIRSLIRSSILKVKIISDSKRYGYTAYITTLFFTELDCSRHRMSLATEENSLKCLAEVTVTTGVDERIQRRVSVSNPEQSGHNDSRWITAHGWRTQWSGQVPAEERKPADEERPDDNPQSTSCFMFTTHSMTSWSLWTYLVPWICRLAVSFGTTDGNIFHLNKDTAKEYLSIDRYNIYVRAREHK